VRPEINDEKNRAYYHWPGTIIAAIGALRNSLPSARFRHNISASGFAGRMFHA
jgi:hypothetical protein